MSLDESTKQLLTDIAENIPKVKQQGYEEGYDKGRTDERSEFWDDFQIDGTRTNYDYAFYQNEGNTSVTGIWTDATFKPKYSIRPTSAIRGFFGLNVTDVAKVFEDENIELDTSQCTNIEYLFSAVGSKRLPVIDMSATTSITGLVTNSYQLEKIDKIIWGENITKATNPFNRAYKLAEFESEGTLAISISFASCPLTLETIKGLIRCLKDCSTTNQGAYTLTLADGCKTALEADTETVSFNGQTYTYFNLITAKGWNLA